MNSKGNVKIIVLAILGLALAGGLWFYLSQSEPDIIVPLKDLKVDGKPAHVDNLTHHSLALKVAFYDASESCEFTRAVVYKGTKKLELNELCPVKPEQKQNLLFQARYSNLVQLGPEGESIYVLLNNKMADGSAYTILVNVIGDLKVAANMSGMGQLRDYNGDKYLDFIKEGGKGITNEFGTAYDPYLIYIQKKTKDGIEFQLDEELSKKFSSENNYQWQGTNYLAPVEPTPTPEPMVEESYGEEVEEVEAEE